MGSEHFPWCPSSCIVASSSRMSSCSCYHEDAAVSSASTRAGRAAPAAVPCCCCSVAPRAAVASARLDVIWCGWGIGTRKLDAVWACRASRRLVLECLPLLFRLRVGDPQSRLAAGSRTTICTPLGLPPPGASTGEHEPHASLQIRVSAGPIW